MSQTLIIELSDEVYTMIQRQAKKLEHRWQWVANALDDSPVWPPLPLQCTSRRIQHDNRSRGES